MCSSGSINWFNTSASTRMSWPTTTSDACLWVAAAVWRTLRCRRGTMVSTGAMRVCEVRCCSSRMRRCCWCRMPARPASSSLSPTPRSRASVVSSISARVSDCTSLYWSISSESKSGCALRRHAACGARRRRGCRRNARARTGASGWSGPVRSSWREWPAADFNSWSSSPILIVSSPTMRTRLSSNSVGTRVVAFGFGARGAVAGQGRPRERCAAAGVSSARWRTVSEASLLRAASSSSMTARALSGRGVFTGDRGHHLLEAVGGGHERLRAHAMRAARFRFRRFRGCLRGDAPAWRRRGCRGCSPSP